MTYAYVAVAAVVASAVLTGVSTVRQGQAQKAQMDYKAAQDAENAKQARAAAVTQEDQQRAKARQLIGTQLAAQSQAGTQLNGTAADILQQSLFNAEADAQNIRYEGETRARGYNADAAASMLAGKGTMTNAYLSAAGSLASSVGSAYGMSKMGGK